MLVAFDNFDGLEAWIAEQRWLAVPGGWVVPEPRYGWRFRVQIVPGGIRVGAFEGGTEPAAALSLPLATLAVLLWNAAIYLDSSALTAGTVQAADKHLRGATMGLQTQSR